MGSKTRLGSYCTKRANNGVNLVTSRNVNTRLARPVKQKFKQYCRPIKNITYVRFLFFSRTQQPGEKFDTFLTDIKLKAKDCEFGNLTDSLVKDRIVCGIINKDIREQFLQDADLTLKKAIDKCRAIEASASQVKNITEDSSVSALTQSKSRVKKHIHSKKPTKYNSKSLNPCGKQHMPRQCPAYGKSCLKCHKFNHFASMCRSKQQTVSELTAKKEDDPSLQYLFLDDITLEANAVSSDWTQDIVVNDTRNISFKLDTTAQANIIPSKILRSIHTGPLKKTNVRLRSYSQHMIQPEGQIDLKCSVNNKSTQLTYQVVSLNASPILGERRVCGSRFDTTN